MFYRTQHETIQEITPEKAASLLELNTFPGQRALSQTKWRGIVSRMDEGTQRISEVAVMTMPDGRKYLANGQHTLTAILDRNKPWRCLVEYYKCEHESDAWRLFGTFDVHATRTEGQILNAARGLLENKHLRELPIRVLRTCGAALMFLGDSTTPDFRLTPPDKTTKASLLDEHAQDVLNVSHLVYGANSLKTNPLVRVSVVTAIIVTLRKNERKAFEFWERVHNGEMLTKDDPRMKLRLYLQEPCRGTSGWTANFRQYAPCILWWNAWRTGEKRSIVKVASLKELPEAVS